MSEKTVTITERDGQYEIQNDGISEFALIGVLECVLFDLKTARTEKPMVEQESAANAETNTEITNETAGKQEESQPEPKRESSAISDAAVDETPQSKVAAASLGPETRTRIANAVKAIKALGGEVDETSDYSNATDEELKTELEELTEQYKRLKSSKSQKR